MHKFLCGYTGVSLISLEYILRSRFAGSHGHFTFNFLKDCQTVFHNSGTISHCHQQCTRVQISPHPSQHLLLSVFLIIASLEGTQ